MEKIKEIITRNEVTKTISLGLLSFLLYVLILYLSRPKIVLQFNPDGKKVINWGILLVLSVILSIGTSITGFFGFIRDRNTMGYIDMRSGYNFITKK